MSVITVFSLVASEDIVSSLTTSSLIELSLTISSLTISPTVREDAGFALLLFWFALADLELFMRVSSWARRSTCALNRIIPVVSARCKAWIKSPTCSICNQRFARSIIMLSNLDPSILPYALSKAFLCCSLSFAKIHAKSRAGSLICMLCQLVIAVIVEPENRKSPSLNPPWTGQVSNDHNPSVSKTLDQLSVISVGIWPAWRNLLIQDVNCVRIWPVVKEG